MNKSDCLKLLSKYIQNENLRHHCVMVSQAMEAYALCLGKTEGETFKWWQAGLLHDLDWEMYPDEHPHKAVNDILPEYKVDQDVLNAILSHAPERTAKYPETEIERYLFACDEISGFMHAVSILRPTAFEGMKISSVTKKLKTLKFAESVPRDDINKGAELINKPLGEHIQFLIQVFE